MKLAGKCTQRKLQKSMNRAEKSWNDYCETTQREEYVPKD
jgi:hypothetical protein